MGRPKQLPQRDLSEIFGRVSLAERIFGGENRQCYRSAYIEKWWFSFIEKRTSWFVFVIRLNFNRELLGVLPSEALLAFVGIAKTLKPISLLRGVDDKCGNSFLRFSFGYSRSESATVHRSTFGIAWSTWTPIGICRYATELCLLDNHLEFEYP